VSTVEGRIQALSRAHTLLSESRWQGVDLGRLVAEEVAPFSCAQSTRIDVSGPAVSLQPATAQSLALALHELMTNCVKYGALSAPAGRLALTWSRESGALAISWIEAGGPPTRQPARYGFGTTLIATSVERQLQGRIAFDWLPEGLRCSMEIPLSNLNVTHGEVEEASEGRVEEGRITIPQTAKRILLVEDEALVALMMHDVLRRQGLNVVGPISTVHEALVVAAEPLDGAILDVNLNGQSIYPVADLLMSRATPFVFVTGYNVSGIDRRYAHVPVLEKPINPKQIHELFGTFTTRD
jgi:CheY-like chemotaxis protein